MSCSIKIEEGNIVWLIEINCALVINEVTYSISIRSSDLEDTGATVGILRDTPAVWCVLEHGAIVVPQDGDCHGCRIGALELWNPKVTGQNSQLKYSKSFRLIAKKFCFTVLFNLYMK